MDQTEHIVHNHDHLEEGSMGYDDRRLRIMKQVIERQWPEKQPVKILDIGYAQQMNSHLLTNPRFEVTGLDINPNRADIHYPTEIQGDATADLSHLGTFDAVIAGAFLEHIENPYAFLRNVHAITHEGSIIILSTPSPIGIPTLFFEWIASKKYFYTDEHCYYFAPRWVERILNHTGWNPVRSIGIGAYFIKFWFPVPRTWSYDIIYVAEKSKHPQSPQTKAE